MRRRLWIALFCCILQAAAQSQNKVNPESLTLNDFSRRIGDYVKLHKSVRSEIHGLKPTDSPEAIASYQGQLARRIREERQGVAQGNIFTPRIATEFHRLIGIAMRGSEGARIRDSLRHAAPAPPMSIRINDAYPTNAPLQSTPPSLLLNLPPLPPEVEYRLVGADLVLRDIDANLIVDILSNALP